MNPDRQRRIEKLLRDAAELSSEEHKQLLDRECTNDPSLRSEIEERLRSQATTASFGGPPGASLAGQTIGSYEVKDLLGAGGMGEVYRAHDTRLGRSVAIKVLSPDLLGDKAHQARFHREARALASLNHPNIASVYGLEESAGRHFLVMELIAGETLATTLARGKLSLEETLRYGTQIANALAAAHAAGIIHRDLKPGNIMIAKSMAKVLDFGLAKSAGDETLTASRIVMGTPAYMAPEQREGKNTDVRSDIYALGLILYEMAAGERFKQGHSPSWNTLPEQFAQLLRQCIADDPDERWQSARDLKAALDLVNIAPLTPVTERVSQRQLPLRAVAAILALAILGAAGTGYLLRGTPPIQPSKFSMTPPEGTAFVHFSQGGAPAVSPDGSRIAFVAEGPKGRLLWVRSVDGLNSRSLAGTESASDPFWSPDGQWIAFFSKQGLEKINPESGQSQLVADQQNPNNRNGTWNEKDEILFSIGGNVLGVIQASSSGPPMAETKRSVELLDENHYSPFFLPNGRQYLLSVRGGPELEWSIWLGTLGVDERRLLVKGARKAVYAPPRLGRTGYLLFVRGSTLMAQPFDPAKGQVSGEPVLLAEHVAAEADFDISPAGVLAYRTEPPSLHDLVWIDRKGKEIGTIGDRPGDSRTNLRISPDGRAVAFTRLTGGTRDVWIHDLSRNVTSRLTLSGGRSPVWSPDGSQIAFVREDSIYRISTSGTGAETLVWRGPRLISVNDWSGDGRQLLLTRWDPTGDRQTWTLTDPTAESGKSEPVLLTRGIHAQFVPSTGQPRWIVYDYGQTFIRSLPGEPLLTRQLSTDGGNGVRSRRDGREVYFSSGGTFVAVDLNFGPPFIASAPDNLFPRPRSMQLGQGQWAQGYDVAPDGSKFVVTFPAPETPAATITLVKDWQALLPK